MQLRVLTLFLLLYGGSLFAKTITVCNSCEYRSIKGAIAAALPHDTLLVKSGVYKEFDLVVDKPLSILGEGLPVIDGMFKGEILRLEADGITVDGFLVRNVGTSYTQDFAAIRVKNSRDFTIRRMQLESLFFGIYIEKSKQGRVLDNIIRGNAKESFNSGNGIQLFYSDEITVERNLVSGVRDGIYLEFADRVIIRGNTSRDNLRYGLHFMFSNNDRYEDNVFENNGAGVAVMFSKQILMRGNTFRNNWGSASFGLLLKEIYDAEITGNKFISNTIAINIEGSTRIRYENNDFSNNGWALKVRGACYSNTFTDNNFLNNSFDLAYNSKPNDNIFQGNYWSKYTGYDLDRDGVGDVPYRPIKLFTYVVNRTPETIVLLRSLFMDILDFSEKVSPVFTPDNIIDSQPKMKMIP